MYLLTEWEGRTGKYLALAPRPSAKYVPVRPDLTQSISIFFFRVTKFGMLLILTEKSGFI